MEHQRLFTPRITLLIGAFLLTVGAATAQTNQGRTPRGEVFGGIGWGKFWHGDHSLGDGIELEAGIGCQPFSGGLRGLGFEFHFSRLGFSRDRNPDYPAEGTTLFLTGNVVYHFGGDAMVRPYVKGGVGLVSAEYTEGGLSQWYDEDGNFHDETWSEHVNARKFGISLGGGLKIGLTERWQLRPEIRISDTTPGSGYNWGALALSIKIGYAF